MMKSRLKLFSIAVVTCSVFFNISCKKDNVEVDEGSEEEENSSQSASDGRI